jgi:hypothetical protein
MCPHCLPLPPTRVRGIFFLGDWWRKGAAVGESATPFHSKPAQLLLLLRLITRHSALARHTRAAPARPLSCLSAPLLSIPRPLALALLLLHPTHSTHTHNFGSVQNTIAASLPCWLRLLSLGVSPRTLPLDTLARSCVRARGALGGRELFCANWSGFGVVCAIVEALALCRSGGEGVWRGTLWSGVVMFGIGGGVGGGEGGM